MDSQPKSSGLVFGRRPLGAILHSSTEPGELSQWLYHDDSTINIVLDIIILLFFEFLTSGYASQHVLSWSPSLKIGMVASGRASGVTRPWVAWLGLLSLSSAWLLQAC